MGTEQGSDAVKEWIARGEDADGRTSPGENFRHRIGKRRRPLRRHLSVRRAEMQCERIRKLISRWHRNKLGAERKAAWRKCSKALAPILDIIRKNAVHASLKAVDASLKRWTLHGNAPHDSAPSLSHLDASRAVLGLAAAARVIS
jgi:hypothetical protein